MSHFLTLATARAVSRRAMGRLAFGMAATVLAAGLFASSSSAATLSIGTNPQGSLAYASGSAIADVVGDAIEQSFTVVPQGGPTAIIPAMSAGEFEFSFANVVAAASALNGTGPFKGRPQKAIRVAAVVYPLRVGVFVRDDSDIAGMADIKGKKVASEFKSQANVGGFLKTAMAMSGVTYDDVTPVPVQNGPQSVNEMIDGAVDVTLFSVGSGVVAKADAAVGVRFLSLPDTDEAKAVLAEQRPGASIATLSDGASTGIKGDTNVIQSPFVVLTSVEVDDETVYRVVKAIAENKDRLAETQGQFKALDPAKMGQSSLPIPYHPGAIKYYEEAGLWN